MTSRANPGKAEDPFLAFLRAAALITMLVGAGGSAVLTLYAGRHNNSYLLILLFTIWVLSPFMVLAFANMVSRHWSPLTQRALYGMTLVLALGSLAIYADVALWPPKAKTAFVFVVVPPASWLLSAIVVVIAELISSRLSRRSDGV